MALPKVKFRFAPLCEGGHSLLKVVAFDFNGQPIPIPDGRFSFNGKYAPESGKPKQWATAKEVEKGEFQNWKIAMEWALKIWENLPKHNVMHGFIADSDYGIAGRGGTIYRQFKEVATKPKPQEFRFCLRLKLANDSYQEFRTVGSVHLDTGEIRETWQDCLSDLQAQIDRFGLLNPEALRTAKLGMVFGDGKALHSDTKDFSLYRIDFNPQTMQFVSRKHKRPLSIHNAARVAAYQNLEIQISEMR